ncbi:MAG: NADH-quinone oxidoreductase subunit C [Methanomassiliicoccales archaeon]|nr:NADH-quinone oxidoreductase subunit C [Methanomassiliicoccales archaeon]
MTEETLEELKAELSLRFGEGIVPVSDGPEGLTYEVPLPRFADVVADVCRKQGGTMLTLHAVDDRARTGSFSLYSVLSLRSRGELLTLMTKATDSFPSLTPFLYYANWYERDVQDMFGLRAVGHPDPRPLVLYDSWPEGNYPLRKDFDARTKVPRVPSPYPFKVVEGDGVFEVPVGPVHAGVIEPGHFRFSIAGEPILNLEVRMGYVHRGVEKRLENASPSAALRLVERISGDNGVAHSLAYCQALERGTAVPEVVEFGRCILAELERIYNHLGDIAGLALDTAFSVPAAQGYSLREEMLRLNQRLTGHRLLWGVVTVGGMRNVFNEAAINDVQRTLLDVGNETDALVQGMIDTPSFMDRAETTGIVSAEVARDLRLVGPVARASGMDVDVRRDHPYAAYGRLNFRVPVRSTGDVLARLNVKAEEIKESSSLVIESIDKMSGDLSPGKVIVPKDGMFVGLVESPRGEVLHALHFRGGKIVRHKVRDASFCNWPGIEMAVLGNIVPDFPLINKSFNLSYAGNDL